MTCPEVFVSETELTQALENTFNQVQQRMQELPFLNPRLQVKALGFRPWQEYWLGVMITPWFMNMMLLPRDHNVLMPGFGNSRSFSFPNGTFAFIGGYEAGLGSYLSCSLMSPLQEMESQALVESVAEASIKHLFSVPDGAGDSAGHNGSATDASVEKIGGQKPESVPPRRELFRRLLGQAPTAGKGVAEK